MVSKADEYDADQFNGDLALAREKIGRFRREVREFLTRYNKTKMSLDHKTPSKILKSVDDLTWVIQDVFDIARIPTKGEKT